MYVDYVVMAHHRSDIESLCAICKTKKQKMPPFTHHYLSMLSSVLLLEINGFHLEIVLNIFIETMGNSMGIR